MSNLIYVYTNTAQEVAQNGIVPLLTIARRKGQSVDLGVNSVYIRRCGYYKITADITYTGGATGTATLNLYNNGVLINGATASQTITTADTEVNTITLQAVVRVCPCTQAPNITIVNTGVAIDTSNINIIVEEM